MKMVFSLALTLAAWLFCGTTRASEWPNFRGPNHNGISSETGWVVKWPEEGPKPLWKASIGLGYSSITVANGRAYASGNQNATATLCCFDAETGSNIWKFTYPSGLYATYNNPASAAPALRPPLTATAFMW